MLLVDAIRYKAWNAWRTGLILTSRGRHDDAKRARKSSRPLAQACVKSAPRASQKIILGTKFYLTRKVSNFNVFDTFFSPEMCKRRKQSPQTGQTDTQEET